MINKGKITTIAIFVAVIGINLFFGLPRISKYTAVDETLWSYDRVPKFWRSIQKANWRGTNLCDKPGITLAAISGAGLPFIPAPGDYAGLSRQSKTPDQLDMIEKIYFSLRLPVYLFTLVSLPLFYILIKRLLGITVARFSVIFIGLSPIILGISLIINTDAILWIMMPLALFSFLIYQKENNRKFLYLAGFLLGLALLTKFVANFLFPFFLVLIFLKYILGDYPKTEDKIAYFKTALADFLILVFIALAAIFVFYPSAWIKPKELLNTTIYSLALKKMWPFLIGLILAILADAYLLNSLAARKICGFFSANKKIFIKTTTFIILALIAFVLLNVYSGMKFYDFEQILAFPKPDTLFFQEFSANIFSSFFPLIYGLTPLVALLFILAIILLAKAGDAKDNALRHAFYLAMFIFAYYFANSLAGISSTVRYQIIIYPVASVIAAIGLHQLISLEPLKKYFLGNKIYFLTIFIFFVSFLSLASIRPFFLAYSSNLLPKQYILNMKDMGDGSWETSQYLNSLPDASRLNVWSDKKQVCEKFIGRCVTGTNFEDMRDNKFDYLVATTGGRTETMEKAQQQKKIPFGIGIDIINATKLYLADSYHDFKINIDNRPNNYIKVVRPNMILNP